VVDLEVTKLRTQIAKSDATSITVRGRDFVHDLIGKRSFSEMIYFLLTSREPTPPQLRILDACLVTIMEHGWTPSSVVTRVVQHSLPSQVQVAIAAGLLTVGDVYAGTMEGCGRILEQGLEHADPKAHFRDLVSQYRATRKPVPGFGHPIHKPDDPRSPALFALAREQGLDGKFVKLIHLLAEEVDRAYGRHLTVNATGAMATLLLEAGLPSGIMRTVSVIARAAGLAGHVAEEQQNPVGGRIWSSVDELIPYEDPAKP